MLLVDEGRHDEILALAFGAVRSKPSEMEPPKARTVACECIIKQDEANSLLGMLFVFLKDGALVVFLFFC